MGSELPRIGSGSDVGPGGSPSHGDRFPSGDLKELCARLGHTFSAPALLETALTHKSATTGGRFSNERLEFLGDAVLGVAVAAALYRQFPDASEGELTRLRSSVVNRKHLAETAVRLRIGACLQFDRAQGGSVQRQNHRILADSLEAILGAVYLDGGIRAAMRVVSRWIVPRDGSGWAGLRKRFDSSKSALQEWLQARGLEAPRYHLVSESGPPHDRVFSIEAIAGEHRARGTAGRKKEAEELAAGEVLRQLAGGETAESEVRGEVLRS